MQLPQYLQEIEKHLRAALQEAIASPLGLLHLVKKIISELDQLLDKGLVVPIGAVTGQAEERVKVEVAARDLLASLVLSSLDLLRRFEAAQHAAGQALQQPSSSPAPASAGAAEERGVISCGHSASAAAAAAAASVGGSGQHASGTSMLPGGAVKSPSAATSMDTDSVGSMRGTDISMSAAATGSVDMGGTAAAAGGEPSVDQQPMWNPLVQFLMGNRDYDPGSIAPAPGTAAVLNTAAPMELNSGKGSGSADPAGGAVASAAGADARISTVGSIGAGTSADMCTSSASAAAGAVASAVGAAARMSTAGSSAQPSTSMQQQLDGVPPAPPACMGCQLQQQEGISSANLAASSTDRAILAATDNAGQQGPAVGGTLDSNPSTPGCMEPTPVCTLEQQLAQAAADADATAQQLAQANADAAAPHLAQANVDAAAQQLAPANTDAAAQQLAHANTDAPQQQADLQQAYAKVLDIVAAQTILIEDQQAKIEDQQATVYSLQSQVEQLVEAMQQLLQH
jgi:hypothetical protein